MSAEPADFTISKRDQAWFRGALVDLETRITALDHRLAQLSDELTAQADLALSIIARIDVLEKNPTGRRVSEPGLLALLYMSAHRDIAMGATEWARNSKHAFSDNAVHTLGRQGYLDRDGNAYRINASGLEYVGEIQP